MPVFLMLNRAHLYISNAKLAFFIEFKISEYHYYYYLCKY